MTESPGFKIWPRWERVWMVSSFIPNSFALTTQTSATECCKINWRSSTWNWPKVSRLGWITTDLVRKSTLSWENLSVLFGNYLDVHNDVLGQLTWIADGFEGVPPISAAVHFANCNELWSVGKRRIKTWIWTKMSCAVNVLCAVAGSIRWIVFVTRWTKTNGLMPPIWWVRFLGKHTRLSLEIGTISTLENKTNQDFGRKSSIS